MPKKIQFSREDILEAAFDLFRKEGLYALSVRKIAGRVGSSTAPVYSCFSGIDEIRESLMREAFERLIRYTEKSYTADIFLNIGVGMLEFAKDFPVVYRTIFLEDARGRDMFQRFSETNRIQMRKEKSLAIFSDREIESILDKLTVYTHGLAAMICAGIIEDTSMQSLSARLAQTGGDIIGATAFMSGKWPEYSRNFQERKGENHENHHDPKRNSR